MKNWNIDEQWTLFLDRDGVINERIFGDYVKTPKEFKFLPGVLDAFSKFSAQFKYIFIVTNQQGIDKGIMSVKDLNEIHQWMTKQIEDNRGRVTAIFYAPELKSNPNHSRKPKPDMALKAKTAYPDIDFNKSIMIGDTDSDIKFGKNLGMKTIRIKYEPEELEPIGIEADLTIYKLSDLL